MSTVFRLSELEHLNTAKEVLRDNEIDFEAMIQRDIVPSHVKDIESYLSKPSERKEVRFFPPLLVALLGYRSGELESLYPQPEIPPANGDEWSITWGDVFQCTYGLPREGERMRTVQVSPPDDLQVDPVDIISYLCTLKINTDAARLVVVDGQHRLRALQDLAETDEGQALLQKLTVPACVIWPPWAYEGAPESGPTVKECLRQIFVDVNSKAKQVSGHFSILLRDDHIAAVGIREFCERMRDSGVLHFVEWNQHIEARAQQLTWFNKVTSVGILWQALLESGATRAGRHRDNFIVNRVFPFLLQLHEQRDEITRLGNQNANYTTITNWDRSFTAGQKDILKIQLQKHFAPAFEKLFTELMPFAEMERVANGVFQEYLNSDARQYRHAVELLKTMQEPEASVHEALRKEIHDTIRDRIQELEGFSPSIYRTQRFQQGLIAALYWFADLVQRNIDGAEPVMVMDGFVRYMNNYVFDGADRLFTMGAPWLEGVVTQGTSGAIIKRQSTRQAVCQLLLSRLGDEQVASDVANSLVGDEVGAEFVKDELVRLGREMAAVYVGQYRKAYRDSFINGLEYDDSLSDEEQGELQALQARLSGSQDVRTDLSIEEAEGVFLEKVTRIVDSRIRPVLTRLKQQLGYPPKQLSEMEMLDEQDDGDQEG